LNRSCTLAIAPLPEILITAIPPSPMGVAMAAMGSLSVLFEDSVTCFNCFIWMIISTII
jgi:hypothetical protein